MKPPRDDAEYQMRMNEMIARLRRVVCCPRPGGCQLPDDCAAHYFDAHARLFLSSLREPTGAMIEAGNAHQTDERGDPCPMTAASVWRVMIEAGLKE